MSETSPVTDDSAVACVTALLREMAADRADTLPALFALVQSDLKRVAHRERLALHAGQTLSTTALINEAYLKLSAATLPAFADRRHFYGVAARAMRQVLVDYARARLRHKRGGGAVDAPLDAALDSGDDPADAMRLLEINDALDRLDSVHPRLAQVVYLRFYGGFSDAEIGAVLEVDESTVRRDWLKARGWLFDALHPVP
jgi:RNA polymerase sigma factor (TIGR02999 family)